MVRKYVDTVKGKNDFTRAQTAFYGLSNGFVKEVGVRKMSLFGILSAVVLGIVLQDWRIVETIVLFTIIIVAFELINSAIEELADHVEPNKSDAIKRVKDLAAGAVFLITCTAVIYTIIDIATRIFKF